MKFVDYVTISVRSGKGGAGSVSFRREKYNPRGGPDGGDGGVGGSVVFQAREQLYTLLDLRFNRHHFAENGHNGSSSQKNGKQGADIILGVPPGTIIKDTDTQETLRELLNVGDEYVVAQGGRGGKGNAFFKSATRQSPRFSQPGEEGEERNITLELKLLADVGLVGCPNAGKSTLVSALSAATPKVADYPFTTLVPSLGVVSVGDYRSFVIADIPGIIEGAHEGKGLGIQFLKHIERNAVLLIMIPVDSDDIGAEYKTLMSELEKFNPRLLTKPRIVGLSKTDLLPPDIREEFLDDARSSIDSTETVVSFSSAAHLGLKTLKEDLWREIQRGRSFD
jgi:GTP-binding protein